MEGDPCTQPYNQDELLYLTMAYFRDGKVGGNGKSADTACIRQAIATGTFNPVEHLEGFVVDVEQDIFFKIH